MHPLKIINFNHMKMKRLLWIVALCLFAVILSCADDSKEAESGDFPIPYPEGGEVITDEWDGVAGHRTVKYPAERHQEMITFYDDYSSGSHWSRTETGAGETLSVIYLNIEKGYTIDLAPPGDQVAEAVVITLYVAA
jgi:hypothetical protein